MKFNRKVLMKVRINRIILNIPHHPNIQANLFSSPDNRDCGIHTCHVEIDFNEQEIEKPAVRKIFSSLNEIKANCCAFSNLPVVTIEL